MLLNKYKDHRSKCLISAAKMIHFFFATAIIVILAITQARGQDPKLPPTNLGMANTFDDMAGKPGFLYQTHVQAFQTRNIYDQDGNKVPSNLKVNSVMQMNPIIYLPPIKLFGGNLAFTLLVPLVQINTTNPNGQAPSANPAILGDIVMGTAIQWSDRRLFGKRFSHRAEFDLSIPVGNYNSRYNINPSLHSWVYSAYRTFTLMLNDKFSVSVCNQLNYSTHFIGTAAKSGAFYNGNYTIDYAILPSLRIEGIAYYLNQFISDSYNGNHHYYDEQFSIRDTKKRF